MSLVHGLVYEPEQIITQLHMKQKYEIFMAVTDCNYGKVECELKHIPMLQIVKVMTHQLL